jgi:di-heme oxidoreductase (putative peroxidase)
VSQLRIEVPIFREPSASADYRDAAFPAGQDPLSRGIDPAFPVSFDLTKDQPDNRILDDQGNVVFRLGSFRTDAEGHAYIDLLGDLKRHDMGAGLAEPIDEVGTGASTFLTENLWGVGSTAPYLHDGRATTLTEAILEHGGEAQASRDAFVAMSEAEQADLLAYLDNQVLFKLEEEKE